MQSSRLEFTVLERRVGVELTGALAGRVAGAALAAFGDLDVGRTSNACELLLETDGRDLPGLLEELGQRLTQWAIGQRRHDLLMLHACAVADPGSGAAVALVGPSGAGKSTAARTLGRSWGYLGDEVVALRADHTLVVHRRPLALLTEAHPAKAQVPADELGLAPAPGRPWLAGLVLLDRTPGADLEVARLATIDALPELAAQASYLASHSRPLQRLGAAAQAAGGVRRVTYGEAAQLEPLVRELVAGAPQ